MSRALGLVASAALLQGGCLADLDAFVHNPRHCSTVGPATCEDQADVKRRLCTPCDAPYPWADFGVPAASVIDVVVELADGATNTAHFIPAAPDAAGGRADVTIVYGHGNYGGIEHYLNRVELLYRTGMNLYVVDYRGYGKSSDPAKPTEAQLYDDAVRARDALDDVAGVDPAAVLLYGYSVGALSIVEMAVQRDACGLLLEAPWPSAQAFTNDSTRVGLPASFIATGAYDNIAKMPDVHAPVLVVHGGDDDFILAAHGQALAAAANEPVSYVEIDGAGHGNFGADIPTVMGEDAYLALVSGFAASAGCGD